uniref:Uncharacterized protein n=1 Tax=Oryza sativa subsp. japonica TaxID=39947 RepID=Q6ATK4_ORYSJ|nr:hypothetical protein [Oryza sativa Japonica Group]
MFELNMPGLFRL